MENYTDSRVCMAPNPRPGPSRCHVLIVFYFGVPNNDEAARATGTRSRIVFLRFVTA